MCSLGVIRPDEEPVPKTGRGVSLWAAAAIRFEGATTALGGAEQARPEGLTESGNPVHHGLGEPQAVRQLFGADRQPEHSLLLRSYRRDHHRPTDAR